MFPKKSKIYIIQNWRYPYICLISVRKKPTKRLTDIPEIQNYLDLVYKHTRKASKKIQKDISSRTGDIPSLA